MDTPDSALFHAVGPVSHDEHQARLELVTKRIQDKLGNYRSYNFTQLQSVALNIFFDLAQEFTAVEDVYAVCVMIPRSLFNLDCTLYVIDGQRDILSCCASHCPRSETAVRFEDEPVVKDGHLLIPIKGNRELISQLPFTPHGDLIGMLELFPADSLTEHDKLFWGRYANRIGYQLHNRFISLKNKEHVQFIRNLVKDIGHNVIVPNMYFKLFYKRLEARIGLIKMFHSKFNRMMQECAKCNPDSEGEWRKLDQDVDYFYNAINDQYKEIFSHYQNTSLFLETLLRTSHFEEGRYVLEKRKCNFKSQVIDPQVERYRSRFADRGIEIDTSMGGVPDREIEVVVDVGLISQVYSNLFSNAVKYTREVDEGGGHKRKFMSYGWDILEGYFGPGLDGIKLNVFSSGPALGAEQRSRLFSEGYRAENSQGEYGTGHGLYFIREVVLLHGGEVGYEPTQLGNNFFIILPYESQERQDDPEA
ncbi:sensor histidine kinase [Fundidesulfovibrio terrae]|uniref:sensor histidine kinase n=1 Tax=Fundidesulfovibrio terrae TaxID=2922866 RepID=UPI001FAE7A41|nr:HAMP domain-containing sensor histidine kinase [Fundidesulfovibrio terrae]